MWLSKEDEWIGRSANVKDNIKLLVLRLCVLVCHRVLLVQSIDPNQKGRETTLLLRSGSTVFNSFKQRIDPLTCNQEFILQDFETMWILDMLFWYRSLPPNCSSIGSYEMKRSLYSMTWTSNIITWIWSKQFTWVKQFFFFLFSSFFFFSYSGFRDGFHLPFIPLREKLFSSGMGFLHHIFIIFLSLDQVFKMLPDSKHLAVITVSLCLCFFFYYLLLIFKTVFEDVP